MLIKRDSSDCPTTEIGYATELKQLAVESCKQLEKNPEFFDRIDSDFIRKVYFMSVFQGAKIELQNVDANRFTLEITGIRVLLDDTGVEVRAYVDPSSISVINITDCGYKICAHLRIGKVEFYPAWDGGRITEIISREGIVMMRGLIEFANELSSHHFNLLEQDRLAG